MTLSKSRPSSEASFSCAAVRRSSMSARPIRRMVARAAFIAAFSRAWAGAVRIYAEEEHNRGRNLQSGGVQGTTPVGRG